MKNKILILLILFGLLMAPGCTQIRKNVPETTAPPLATTTPPPPTTQPPVETLPPMSPEEESLKSYLSENTEVSVNKIMIYNGSGTLNGSKVAYVKLNLRPGMDFFDAMQDAVDAIYGVFEGDSTIDVVRTSNVDKTEISERVEGVRIEEVIWTNRETAMGIDGWEDMTPEEVINHFNYTTYTG